MHERLHDAAHDRASATRDASDARRLEPLAISCDDQHAPDFGSPCRGRVEAAFDESHDDAYLKAALDERRPTFALQKLAGAHLLELRRGRTPECTCRSVVATFDAGARLSGIDERGAQARRR